MKTGSCINTQSAYCLPTARRKGSDGDDRGDGHTGEQRERALEQRRRRDGHRASTRWRGSFLRRRHSFLGRRRSFHGATPTNKREEMRWPWVPRGCGAAEVAVGAAAACYGAGGDAVAVGSARVIFCSSN
ncbi:uncharacterized protein LOC110263502 [Arachis ipaensis]|uniref:uncharacterized protein LOC110263502 n=1 Tax=Arachis ipaensis TaxID=130454 RepID=UPI000A2AF861|nr:uncharacterized protein LOC110263502 [Arachis ipaensis]